MSTTTRTLTMKLLIDTKANRVVFAEAGKDVVDFLFSLLTLPVATIVNKLCKGWLMPGSFGNLYCSVEKLDDTYVLPGAKKKAVLKPAVVPSAATTTLFLPALSSSEPKSFRCSSRIHNSCYEYVTDTRGTRCPSCSNMMNSALKFVAPVAGGSGHDPQKASSSSTSAGAAKGLVKDAVTYTVRDDLTVAPMSSISSITMLNAAGVTDFTVLREKTVRLGYIDGLFIVRASLQSKTVLTDVYLGGNKRPRD